MSMQKWCKVSKYTVYLNGLFDIKEIFISYTTNKEITE